MKFVWEEITSLNGTQTYRAKVIGGWLVNNFTCVREPAGQPELICESMVFVPDPGHKWIVNEVSI